MSKIKTTHVGSLPRSNDLSELLFKKDKKEEIDSNAFDEIVKRDVNNNVIREWVLFDEIAIWKQILMNK